MTTTMFLDPHLFLYPRLLLLPLEALWGSEGVAVEVEGAEVEAEDEQVRIPLDTRESSLT